MYGRMQSVKELCRDVSAPTTSPWTRLVRVGKYVTMKLRIIMKLDYQEKGEVIDGYSDACYAGCKATRRSTSGGCPEDWIPHHQVMSQDPKLDNPFVCRIRILCDS